MPSQLPLHLTGVFMRIISQTITTGNLVVGLVTAQRARSDSVHILWAEDLLHYYRDVLEVLVDAEPLPLRPAPLRQTLDTLIHRGEIPLAVLTRPRGSTQTDCHWDVEAVGLSACSIEALTTTVQETTGRFFASLPSKDEPRDTTGPALPPVSIPKIARSLHHDIELARAQGERFLALVLTKPGRNQPALFWDTDLMLTLDPTESVPRRTLAAHLREAQIRGILQAGFFPVALAFFTHHKGPYLAYDTAELTGWGFDAEAELDRADEALRRTLTELARPWAALDN